MQRETQTSQLVKGRPHLRLGPSRTARGILLRDRGQVAVFVARVCRWDFERIAVAHDAVLETGGREALSAALHAYV